ncbi:carcinine transporter-like [Epargyreus clarus]|uniref:carcinine transporter-like n=1 Tax=Epargyreus clarus TaxID=520877 RepID=UPI003C2D8604
MSKEEKIIEDEDAKTNKNLLPKEDPLEAMLAHVGEMGRYQKYLLLGMCPFGVLFSIVYFVQMFITLTPQAHWCRVPELSHLAPEVRRNLTSPKLDDEYDKCSMFVANWSHVLETMTPPHPSTPTTACLYGWDFEFTDIPYPTVVSDRGWVCEKSGYVPTAQTMFFAGSFVGVIFFGWMADTYGRVPALVASTTMAFFGGIATIFTSGFWDFMICRFITGLSYDSIIMLIYILVLEYIGPRYRTLVANTTMAIYYGGGCLLLPWLALWLADWRKLLWVTSGPLVMIAIVPFTVPESARWLLTRGRVDGAVKMLRKFERINRRTIPQDELEEFIVKWSHAKQSNESIKSLFKSALLRKMLVFQVVLYMMVSLVYDALVRMSENLGVDVFLTFTLASATEIPAIAIVVVVLDRWGRRNVTSASLAVAGIVSVFAVFLSKGVPLVATAVFARFLINISFTALMQWTAELLPTSVRASGSSFIHVSIYLSTMLSPFVVYSAHVWLGLPFVILALLLVMAAGFSVMLPETMGRPLPQTFEEGETLIREYSLCGKTEDADVELQYRKRSLIIKEDIGTLK